MQFQDALSYRHRLRVQVLPATWTQAEVQCPSCQRLFVARVSPREDPVEGRMAARRYLIRTCPNHAGVFRV